MISLKQIIISRIKNTIELEEFYKHQTDSPTPSAKTNHRRYNIVMKHKRMEDMFKLKQISLVSSLTQNTINEHKFLSELYPSIAEIISTYNPEFSKFVDKNHPNLKIALKDLLVEFCTYYNLLEKIKIINLHFQKEHLIISPAVIMGWLSDWSKQVYHRVLLNEKYQPMAIQPKSGISISCGGSTNENADTIEKREYQAASTAKFQVYQNTSLILFTKANVHSYYIEELNAYYKLTSIDDLDFSYLKNIKKKHNKINTTQKESMKKVIQILIQVAQNKKIQNTIKLYEEQYFQKYQVNEQKVEKAVEKKFTFVQKNIPKKKTITENSLRPNLKASAIQSKIIFSQIPKFPDPKTKRPDFHQKIQKIRTIKARSKMILPQIGISKSLERQKIVGQKPILVRFPTHIESSDEKSQPMNPLIMRKFQSKKKKVKEEKHKLFSQNRLKIDKYKEQNQFDEKNMLESNIKQRWYEKNEGLEGYLYSIREKNGIKINDNFYKYK